MWRQFEKADPNGSEFPEVIHCEPHSNRVSVTDAGGYASSAWIYYPDGIVDWLIDMLMADSDYREVFANC